MGSSILTSTGCSTLGAVLRGTPDGLADQPHVEVEADVGDVPGLLAAEQVAGAADLEVLHRDRHAATEVGVLGQGGQPLVGGLGQRLVRRVEEVGVGPLAGTPDATAQLVQLGETEGVGALDDHRVGVGHVEARTPRSSCRPARRSASPRSRASPARAGARPSGRGRSRPVPRARAAGSCWPPSRSTAPGCGCRTPGRRGAARGVRQRRPGGPRRRRRRSAPGAAPPAASRSSTSRGCR